MLYAFNIAKNPIYDGYQHGLASMVCISFIKKVLVMLLKKYAKWRISWKITQTN